MGNPSSRAERELADRYSANAEVYARYWAPVLRPMAGELISRLPLGGAARVLDLGCGTGGLLAELAEAAPRARAFGADRAAGMLRVASRDPGRLLALTDATRSGFRSGTFDVVVMAFMLFHLADPPAGLREACRILRPDGTAGIVVWGKDAELPCGDLWREALDSFGAGPDPRDPEIARHDLMDTPAKLRRLIRDAGFPRGRTWGRRFTTPWSRERLLETQAACGWTSRRLETLAEPARAACRAHVGSRMAGLGPEELTGALEVVFGIASRSG